LDQFPQYGEHQVSLFAVELIEVFFNRLGRFAFTTQGCFLVLLVYLVGGLAHLVSIHYTLEIADTVMRV
jgi:hypothetical protein